MQNIKERLHGKIKEKQSQLIEKDINSKEYTCDFYELELLNLEYRELVNLRGNNYIKNIEKYKELKSKYSFLQTLSMEQILSLLENIRIINKQSKENINIEFSELLTDFKNEILINGIKIESIENSEKIDQILSILTKKYKNFKESVEELYTILKHFYPKDYEIIEDIIKDGKFLSVTFLNEIRGLGQDTLIDAIIEKYKLRKKIKNDIFLTPKTKEEKIESLNNKIKEYTKSLYRGIGLYVKQNYKEYKDRIGLNIDEYEEENVVKLYRNILNQIADKNSQIAELIKKYNYLKETYLDLEVRIKNNLNKIGFNIEKLKSEGIDIFTMDKEDVFEILAQINLYTELNLETKKTNEESPKLSLKAEESND